jgi:hypothetical protein
LLTSSGISDFHINFAQNDLRFTQMSQARLTGQTELPRQIVARNGMLRPAARWRKVQREAKRGKTRYLLSRCLLSRQLPPKQTDVLS